MLQKEAFFGLIDRCFHQMKEDEVAEPLPLIEDILKNIAPTPKPNKSDLLVHKTNSLYTPSSD